MLLVRIIEPICPDLGNQIIGCVRLKKVRHVVHALRCKAHRAELNPAFGQTLRDLVRVMLFSSVVVWAEDDPLSP